MAFKTQCPHCGITLEVDDQWVGMECQCPQCQKTFIVPPKTEEVKPAVVAPVAPPAAPQPQMTPTTAPAPQFQAPPKTNAAPQFHVPPKTNAAPQFHVPPKTNFGHVGNANPAAAQPGPALNKLIICPKCKKQHTVMQCGTYTCSCGSTLELLETGAIHVSVMMPKHTPAFWVLFWVLGALGALVMLIVIGSLLAAI